MKMNFPLIAEQWRGLAVAALLWIPLSLTAVAQSNVPQPASVAPPVVPQQMRFAATVANRAGDTVQAEFRIYAAAEGGEPLWTETQQVQIGANGEYSVLLGSATPGGLPQTLFAYGQARWLGVSIERAEEFPRTQLTSVAYAMKAGDAETVGGLPAARFVTQEQIAAISKTSASQAALAIVSNTALSGSGTADYVPLWTSSTTLGNSAIYQHGTQLGIGTTSPGGPLEIATPYPSVTSNSTNYIKEFTIYTPALPIASGITDSGYRIGQLISNYTTDPNFLGTLTSQYGIYAQVGAYTGSGSGTITNSYGVLIANETGGSAKITNSYGLYQSGAAARNYFAGKVGIGTTNPSATLEVNGTAKFDGNITFASTQTFPVKGTGGGTITGISTSSPLTGSGTSGAVALGLNQSTLVSDITPTLESNFNSVYAQLGAGNTFSTGQTINGATTISASNLSGPGLSVTNGGEDVYATGITVSDGGQYATGVNASGGLFGVYANAYQELGAAGVLGYLGGSSSNSYGTLADSYGYSAGVWADGPDGQTTGLIATADDQPAAILYNNSSSDGTLSITNASTGGLGNSAPGIATVLRAGGPNGEMCGINQKGSLTCTGQVKSVVATGRGSRQVEIYAVHSAENWIEDYGSGQLNHGGATIALDPAFAETVNTGVEYHVFLTPGGDCKGLYVTNKTPAGFEVHELGGGTTSIPFDYKIVAKRNGFESQRLVDVTERMKREGDAASFKPLAQPLPMRRPAKPGQAAATGRGIH
jgi:hypothetical protein